MWSIVRRLQLENLSYLQIFTDIVGMLYIYTRAICTQINIYMRTLIKTISYMD